MRWLMIALFLPFVVPVALAELRILDFPFVYEKDWKRSRLISTPLNLLFHILMFLMLISIFFDRNIVEVVGKLTSLNCSYQDIGRLCAAGVIYFLISAVVVGGYFVIFSSPRKA